MHGFYIRTLALSTEYLNSTANTEVEKCICGAGCFKKTTIFVAYLYSIHSRHGHDSPNSLRDGLLCDNGERHDVAGIVQVPGQKLAYY